jgi:subtilisin family serine protease
MGRSAAVVTTMGALVLPGSLPAAAAPASNDRAETIVVKMKSPAVAPASIVAASAGITGLSSSTAPADRYMVRVPAGVLGDTLAALRSNPAVAYAEVPQTVHATVTPNDTCYVRGCLVYSNPPGYPDSGLETVNQAYLNTIGAPAAWAVSTGAGVRVAVLDTGADTSNPDLAGKIASFTNVCIDDDPLCAGDGDPYGHGTHVTGIVAADTNNGIGVASLGWNVHVDEYKVLDSDGDGNTADVATAIYEAVANGDRVINMSFSNWPCGYVPSDCGPDPDEAAAVEYALAHNVVVVAAAGNGGPQGQPGLNQPDYPAAYPGVLSVAATDNDRNVEGFSEWGSAANIAAPGFNIVSTWNNNGYHALTGTSMAAPQVSAAAALMIAHDPSLTAPQITELLESSPQPTAGGEPINGGELDVPAALAAESGTPPSRFDGYELAGSDGSVYSFGSTAYLGDLYGHPLNKPVVGITMASNGLGYWMDASDGGVFNFGDAGFYGSTGNVRLNKPVVGMASTPAGRGYWLVASDGGIFEFGDAGFYGSTGNVRLNKPVVGMASTPDGRGYWLVAADGGIFEFGDAGFYGSTGNVRLNQPVVGMASTPDGRGYWLVAADGGIFEFGDAHFYGSTGNIHLNKPIVGMAPDPSGGGYTLVASDGGVFDFGNAPFWGSAAASPIPAPVVGVTS